MPEIKNLRSIAFVDGGSPSIDQTENIAVYEVIGTGALTSNWGVTLAAAPVNGMVCKFIWHPTVTLAGNAVSFFGVQMPDHLVNIPQVITCLYTTAWNVVYESSFAGTSIISTAMIVDKAVTLDKMDDINTGSIYIGSPTKRPIELAIGTSAQIPISTGTTLVYRTISNDATITNTGVLTIANNAITTGKIIDEAVTMDKLADLARSSMITGQTAGNRPAALAIGNMAFPMGNGTDITAVTMAGDATMSNTGHITITKGTYSSASGVTTGILQFKDIGHDDLRPLLDGATNNLFAFSTSDIIVGAKIFVGTASGVVQTINIGVDASLRTAGADTNGLLKDANSNAGGVYADDNPALTYQGAELINGSFTCQASGYVTITATADLSATAIHAKARVYYIAV
jgi:hypothetical protein